VPRSTSQICGVRSGKCARTSTAVVGSLWTRETTLGPTVRVTVDVEQGVLLFKTEPGLGILGKVHDLGSMMTIVGLVGSAVVVVAFGEDDDVVATTEGVLEDGARLQVDVGVATRSLVGGRAVEVPNAQLTDVGDFLVNGLYDDGQPIRQQAQVNESIQ